MLKLTSSLLVNASKTAADRIDRPGDVFSRAILGSFEHHVLDEVRDSVLRARLEPGAAADPDAERNGADVRHTSVTIRIPFGRVARSISRT